MTVQHASRSSAFDPASISRHKKARFLLALTPQDFRDQVIRPLFRARGLKEIAHENNNGELVFVAHDSLLLPNIYVVFFKAGSLTANMTDALGPILAEMEAAKKQKFRYSDSTERRTPAKLLFCSNGRITPQARRHIAKKLDDPRLDFLDADDLIGQIDELLGELWLGIDPELMPYLRRLKDSLQDPDDVLSVADVLPGKSVASAITDEMFVPLKLFRVGIKIQKRKGEVTRLPHFEQIPAPAVLQRSERQILLLGDAGSGKSTILRRLAYVVAQKGIESPTNAIIPILLRASDISRSSSPDLVDLIAENIAAIAGGDVTPEEAKHLIKSQVVLLVDALDELPTDEERASTLRRVNNCLETLPGCRIIATSRTFAFVKRLPELEGYLDYTISALDFKQTEQIITRLEKKRSLSSERSQELLRRLQQVHGVELNPLLVTVFAATTEYSRQDIPANITELFKKYTEIMLGRWDASKGLAHQYHAPLKDFLLKTVAYNMHRKRHNYIKEGDFRAFIDKELSERGHKSDVQELTDEIIHRSGLFRVVGDQVEFRHLLLQEFFAGRGIPSNKLNDYVADDWWQRAIVFYFGENPSDAAGLTALVSTLAARSEEDLFQTALTLGIALQACYLVPVEDKLLILSNVIIALSLVKDQFITSLGAQEKYPINGFLIYYLFGRDAVACSVLQDHWRDLKLDAGKDGGLLDGKTRDLRTFWVIIGLIESGALGEAEALCHSFNPHDPRMLFAIYLACALILQVRVHTEEERRIARRLYSYLNAQMEPLKGMLLKEVKSGLLEVRQGKIHELEG
jgi:GTPase SAR1 family protein